MIDTKRLSDERTKKVIEQVTYEIPWWHYTGRTWRPGERYIIGTYVRPTRPNGFEFECTTAGQTSAREPQSWPTTVGVIQGDGSVTWTCRGIGNNALDTISGTPVWTSDPGITLSNPQVDAIKQLTSIRIAGGDADKAYRVKNRITTVGGDVYDFDLTENVIA